MFARIAESGIASMSPAPNTGVGMRKNDVRITAFAGEWFPAGRNWAGDVAPRGVLAAGDDEQVMHAAVVGPVRIALEACLADGTVLRDEPWHHVSCALERGDPDQGLVAGLDPPTLGCE